MAEKTDFSRTCNRLSQYLKENKACFGDLSFSQCDSGKSPAMNLFPQETGFGSSISIQDVDLSETHEPTNKAGGKQMTIVYGGKVVVFDDMSAEKAKEVLTLAMASVRSNSLVEHMLCPIPANVQSRNPSLRSFLEKRKERIKARVPYQVNVSAAATTKEWLGLASPSL